MNQIMKITTTQILKVLYVFAWIIFIGISILAGGVITNTIGNLAFEPEIASRLWKEVDLSGLYAYNQGYFLIESLYIILVTLMKAILFYLIINILHTNKVSMIEPFNTKVGTFINRLSFLALIIGLFSIWGMKYTNWLMEEGVDMPDIQKIPLGGGDVWIFMAITLFVIAKIYKRGIEIQEENDLTV